MLSFKLTIDSVVYDISPYINSASAEPTFVLHQDLQPYTNSISFSISRNCPAIPYLKVTRDYVEIEVKDGTTPYFKGYLTDNYKWGLRAIGSEDMQLSAEDPGIKKLKVPWKSTNLVFTKWNGLKVSNPLDTATSFIHNMAALAGVVVDPSVPAIDKDVYIIVRDSESKTYWEITQAILFNFGYVFGFNESGYLTLYNINQTTTTSIATLSPINGIVSGSNSDFGLYATKRLIQYKEADISWKPRKTVTGITIHNDISNQTDEHTCVIKLEAGAYYPTGSTSSSFVMTEYVPSDSSNIINVIEATPDFKVDDGITWEFENLGKQAKIRFHNTTGSDKYIYQIKVIGDSVVEEAASTTTVAGYGTPVFKYDAEHITVESDASKLGNLVLQYYQYGSFKYQVKSDARFDIGSIVTINDSIWTGDNAKVVILSRIDRYNEKGTIAYYQYECTGIDNFSTSDPTTSNTTITNPLGTVLTTDLAGLQSKSYENRYVRSATTPPTPVGRYPEGWYLVPPSGSDTLWVSTAQYYASAFAGIIPGEETYPASDLVPGTGWSDPIAIASMPTNVTTATVSSMIPVYLGAFADLPTNYKTGDYFFYIGTTTAYLTQYLLYIWNGVAWVEDNDSGHLSNSFNDVFAYAPNGSRAVAFINTLAASTAFIQSLFAKNIQVQSGGSIYAGYNADGSGSPSQGFWLGANGQLKARNVDLSGSINATSGSFTNVGITGELSLSGITAGNNIVKAQTGYIYTQPSTNGYWYPLIAQGIAATGTIRTYYEVKDTATYSTVRMYKNGSPIGTAHPTTSSWVGYTEDFACNEGDVFQVYVYLTRATDTLYIQNFKLSIAGTPGILKFLNM